MSEFPIEVPISPVASMSLEDNAARRIDGMVKLDAFTLHVDELDLDQPFEFLNLPREIRDSIYSLLFLHTLPVYPNKERADISTSISLLRTNRQIYSEALEILYGRNTFQIRGTHGWATPHFLNLLGTQRRDGYAPPYFYEIPTICRARFFLKRLYIPSHNINLNRLKHLFSLLKFFPNLEHLRVVYNGSFGMKDMDVVNVLRLFMDRRPLFGDLVLCKRISYKEAEDISWIIHKVPYKTWTAVPVGEDGKRHLWRDQDGRVKRAEVVVALQNIPE